MIPEPSVVSDEPGQNMLAWFCPPDCDELAGELIRQSEEDGWALQESREYPLATTRHILLKENRVRRIFLLGGMIVQLIDSNA